MGAVMVWYEEVLEDERTLVRSVAEGVSVYVSGQSWNESYVAKKEKRVLSKCWRRWYRPLTAVFLRPSWRGHLLCVFLPNTGDKNEKARWREQTCKERSNLSSCRLTTTAIVYKCD
jgi:hypothetical protein